MAECAREGVFVRIVETVSSDGFLDLFGEVRLEPPDQALGNERCEVVGLRHGGLLAIGGGGEGFFEDGLEEVGGVGAGLLDLRFQ